MNTDVYINNKKKFEENKKKIKDQGLDSLYILSDFDKTLTHELMNGKKTPSMIAILRDNKKYLDEEYLEKAHLFAQKYFPIQTDFKINKKEKSRLMEEWWIKHLELLIEKKLNKNHFKQIVDDRKIKFRNKSFEFFNFLDQHNVPLIIISASPLGTEPISMFFKKEHKLYSNIHIISNSFVWDENNNAIVYKKPIVHCLNKDEVLLNDLPVYEKIKNRKNILLLGDSLDDVGMIGNLKYENLIKVCFLSNEMMDSIDEFKKVYDVLILNDSSMEFINDFLKTLAKIK
jgi:cytosolic 5'-nucleotidase 3